MSETILLIDDSRTVQMACALILAKEKGLRLEVAGNAREALLMLNEVRPALVIIDHSLPDLNAYELAGEINKDTSHSFTPVVLLSGPHTQLDSQKAARFGIKESLVKPFTSDEFIASIRRTLDRRGTRDNISTPSIEMPLPLQKFRPDLLSLEPPSFSIPDTPKREAIEEVTRQIIEQIAWEVVPQLAESIIKEEINRLLRQD